MYSSSSYIIKLIYVGYNLLQNYANLLTISDLVLTVCITRINIYKFYVLPVRGNLNILCIAVETTTFDLWSVKRLVFGGRPKNCKKLLLAL